MKNKILAIMLAGMMTGMMAAPAAVSAADVNPLEQLVNEMSDQILPNPDAETADTNNDSSVLADAGNKNDEIDPSFSQYDSILAPSSRRTSHDSAIHSKTLEEVKQAADITIIKHAELMEKLYPNVEKEELADLINENQYKQQAPYMSGLDDFELEEH